jgi:hypothetical protein
VSPLIEHLVAINMQVFAALLIRRRGAQYVMRWVPATDATVSRVRLQYLDHYMKYVIAGWPRTGIGRLNMRRKNHEQRLAATRKDNCVARMTG